jgi:alpha-galactosidase
MVTNAKKELADFANKFPELKGYEPELAGFVWHQGFNDMVRKDYAPTKWAEYTKWTAAMIKDLRKDLDAPNLPVVIGELGTCGVDKRGDFQAAQAAIAKLPEFEGTVVFVETAQYLDPVAVQWFNEGLWKKGEEEKKKFETVASGRPYHYYGSGKTFFLKGVAFGEAMVKLKKH